MDTLFGTSATVSNTGAADAISVTLTLSVTGSVSLLGDAERAIGDLNAEATSDPVTWTLHCNSPEAAEVEARPAGIEVNTSIPIPAAEKPDSPVPARTCAGTGDQVQASGAAQ
ncbi:MAG: hypothetical protein U9Q78_04190 [Chloroflexota bacterium]|nr:hypothetical protein [Chloroflexota bacterium]